jgi:hypothetical protein
MTMAKKKKKTYREACATDLGNGNHSKFSKACARRFPELAKKNGVKVPAGEKPVPSEVPQECRDGLSRDMKKGGDRKGAFGRFWACRREAAAAD